MKTGLPQVLMWPWRSHKKLQVLLKLICSLVEKNLGVDKLCYKYRAALQPS